MQVFFILAAWLTAALAQCPSTQWTLLPDGRRCFLAVTYFYNYDAARDKCRSLGGSLAMIRGPSDTTAALAATKCCYQNVFWIGLYKLPTGYRWIDGSALNYTNWKSGCGPIAAPTDLVVFDGVTGKWMANNLAHAQLQSICEVPAFVTCPYEKLKITGTTSVVFETDGASKNQTISAFNCTKEVSVTTPSNAYIHVKIRVFAKPNAFIRFFDIATGTQVELYTDTGTWIEEEFHTHSNSYALRLQAYADRYTELGYRIEFTALAGQCPSSHWTLFDGGKRCLLADSQLLTYSRAQDLCRTMYRGFLATVRSSADNPAYRHASSWGPMHQFWIGLYKNATSQTYVWDEGRSLSYTNWKPGKGPTSTVPDCVTYDAASGQWIGANLCSTPRIFFCETIAIKTCSYEKLQVTYPYMVTLGTENASLKKTVSAYNCTKDVTVGRKGSEALVVKVNYFADNSGFVTLINPATRKELKRYTSTGGQWKYETYQTSIDTVTIEMFAFTNGNLGATVDIETEPIWNRCLYEKFQVSQGSMIAMESDYASIKKTVSSYNCTKEVSVINKGKETVVAKITTRANSEAYVRLVNIATGQELKRYTSTNGEWKYAEFNTGVDAVRVEMFSSPIGLLGTTMYFEAKAI